MGGGRSRKPATAAHSRGRGQGAAEPSCHLPKLLLSNHAHVHLCCIDLLHPPKLLPVNSAPVPPGPHCPRLLIPLECAPSTEELHQQRKSQVSEAVYFLA